MSQVNRPPFEEEFTTILYQLMKFCGINVDPLQYENIKSAASRLGSAVRAESRKSGLELVKRLQEATSEGFTKFGVVQDELEKKVQELEERVKI
jgi:phosphoribosylanthranilate isomerase